MTTLERITRVLERARIDGGWDDENVALKVLEAAREPDAVMKTAGYYASRFAENTTTEDAGDCFRAMIDKARDTTCSPTSSSPDHG